MHWYKFAKLQIEALNKRDLYDFYLIARISQDHFEYLFKTDPQKKFYFAKKLDEIKNEYIKGGIFAVNLELSHTIDDNILKIESPEELSQAAKYFMDYNLWPGSNFAGESWALIAEKIYDLSQFSNLTDDVVRGINDSVLINRIYKLIFKIDHINDICHNTGIALPKMMNENYKGVIPLDEKGMPDLHKKFNEIQDYYVSSLDGNSKYSNTKEILMKDLKSFLDYKRDGEILHLLGHRDKIDSDLLESLRGIKASEKISPYNIIEILKKWNKGVKRLSLEDVKKLFIMFLSSNHALSEFSFDFLYLLRDISDNKLKKVFDKLAKEDLSSLFSENLEDVYNFFNFKFDYRSAAMENFNLVLFKEYFENIFLEKESVNFFDIKDTLLKVYDLEKSYGQNFIDFQRIWKKISQQAILKIDINYINSLLQEFLESDTRLNKILEDKISDQDFSHFMYMLLNRILNKKYLETFSINVKSIRFTIEEIERSKYDASPYLEKIHSLISSWNINGMSDILNILKIIPILGLNVDYNLIKNKIEEILSIFVYQIFRKAEAIRQEPEFYLLEYDIIDPIGQVSNVTNLDLRSMLLKRIEDEKRFRESGGQTNFDFEEK